jgi:hypothetical protein
MSNSFYKRLGIGLVGLALPLMLAAPVAAQPHPDEVGHVATECIVGLGADIHDCSFAVKEGVGEVAEQLVNADLEAQGIDWAVDVLQKEGSEPDDFPVDIQDIAVNPLPPSVTDGNPPVPGIVYP